MMVRLCERPGCSVAADVSYGFDADSLIVWIDGTQVGHGPSSGVLCRRHADAMVVPLGWMLDDRRDPAPRLFRTRAEPPTGPMIRPRARRVRRDPAYRSVQLELEPEQRSPVAADISAQPSAPPAAPPPEPPQPPEAQPEPEAEQEIQPWQPVFDQRDDLKGLLKARGRLLSRAFNGVRADATEQH